MLASSESRASSERLCVRHGHSFSSLEEYDRFLNDAEKLSYMRTQMAAVDNSNTELQSEAKTSCAD